jgi:hypothetical protein
MSHEDLLQFRERTEVDVDVLIDILDDGNTSYPIVALHPEHYAWQPGINTDDRDVSKHAAVLKEFRGNRVV